MSDRRCFDCFHDFAPDEDRFAVLKKLRDIPEDWNGSEEARIFAWTACFDQVFVCADCAAWYGDHPLLASPLSVFGDVRNEARGRKC